MKKFFKDVAVGKTFINDETMYVKISTTAGTLANGKDSGVYGFIESEEVEVIPDEVKARMTHIAMPVISDKIIKHIADMGYIQRDDGKIMHVRELNYPEKAQTTYEDMEDLIMSALTRQANGC